MQTLQENPVRLALVGTGNRSRKIYQPLWEGLKPWIQLVAVCDPVKESADQYAEALGVKAYYDLREMAKDPDIEAAVVVAPIAVSYTHLDVYKRQRQYRGHDVLPDRKDPGPLRHPHLQTFLQSRSRKY